MPDSLIFDGADDRIVVGGLPASLGSGAMTILFIVKADVWNSYTQVQAWNAIDGGLMCNNNSPENLIAGPVTGNSGASQFGMTETDWVLIGWGKAAGTVAAQFHKYVYATNAWTHSGPTGGNPSDDMPALTSMWIGESSAFPGSGFFDGNMLIAGIWNSKLSDAAVEALAFSKQAWIDAAPAVGIRFDSASALSVFAGTATQTSRTGTTLDVGDVPTGPGGTWTEGDSPLGAYKFDGVDDDAIWMLDTGETIPVSDYPFTLGMVFMAETAVAAASVFGLHDSDNAAIYQQLQYLSAHDVSFRRNSGGGGVGCQSANIGDQMIWQTGVGVGNAVADVACFRDGANKGTNTTSRSFAGGNSIVIGRFNAGGTTGEPFDGWLAYAFIWNVALSDAEVAQFHAGTLPQEAALQSAYDFTYDQGTTIVDPISGRDLTVSGAVYDGSVLPAPVFAFGEPAAPPQQIRPDADVTTTGWTTAPLWSKVDEAVVDDGDFITATAS